MAGISPKLIKELRKTARRLWVACPLDFSMAMGDYTHMLHYVMRAPLPPEVRLEQVAKVMRAIEEKSSQLAYLYHMEFSGHGKAFVRLCRKAKVKFRTPMLDVGTGVGSLIWWLRHEGMLPEGNISLIDIDQNMIDYAKTLLLLHYHKAIAGGFEGWYTVDETERQFLFRKLDGCDIFTHLGELRGPFQTILSALVIQWVDRSEEMIKAIAQSLRPDGEFVFVGEDDPDAVSLTPLRFPLSLPRGKPLGEIIMYCLKAGLELVQIEEELVPNVNFPRPEDIKVIKENQFEKIEKLQRKRDRATAEFKQAVGSILRQFIKNRRLRRKIDVLHTGKSEIWTRVANCEVDKSKRKNKLIYVARQALPHKMIMLIWRRKK